MRMIEKTAVDAVCEKYQDYGLSNGTTLGHHSGIVESIISDLESLPTIEAEPVRHGFWDDSGRYHFVDGGIAIRCSECGCSLHENEYELYAWDYCPICGAKMDGAPK